MVRTAALAALALALGWQPTSARAQTGGDASFALETFEPQAAQGLNLLNLSSSRLLPHLGWAAGALLHYADDPLTVVENAARDQVVQRIIDQQLTADVSLAVGLFDVASLALVLPVTVSQRGDDLALFGRPGASVDSFALGDLRVLPKVVLLAPADFGGFGVHVTLPIHLPTGDDGSFKTDGGVRLTPTLGLDYQTDAGLLVALNAGYQVRPERKAHNYVSDDQLMWAFGLRVPLTEQLRVVGSLFGSVQTATSVDPVDLSSPLDASIGTPVEALGGVELALLDGLVVGAGAGAALVHGVGSPDVRAYLNLGWTPLGPLDSDADGIPNADDRCPSEPEDLDGFQDGDGCPDPDNDHDGFPDPLDGCRDEPEDPDGFEDDDGCPDPDNDGDGVLDVNDRCPTDREDRDGFQDDDGCPDPDNDGDGILDADDRCPDEAEDADGIADEDGCPEVDFDGDGVPDEADRCPRRPETPNGYQDEDGCPDTRAKDVEITGTEIRIKKSVFFYRDLDTLKAKSFPILDSVASVLAEQPFITKVRIEGHTDSEGPEEFNLELSQKRAETVRRYLIDKGIDGGRLVAKGYGESAPIATNTTPMGRAKNRRVDFKIVEINGAPITPDTPPPAGVGGDGGGPSR